MEGKMVILTEENIKKYDLAGFLNSLNLKIGDKLYLNDVYLHPENYINNPKTKVKPKVCKKATTK